MKIGPQKERATALSASNASTILVRGRDLCGELIGRIGFTDHFWLLLTGSMPNEAQRRVLDATLVAIAEHGLVPSVQVSRMTLAAAPEALQGAVAAGILGCGSVVLGSAEAAGRFLGEIVQRREGGTMDAAAEAVVTEHRQARRAIPGYGHPLHKGRDPRAQRLFEIARELKVAGDHVAAALAAERAIPAAVGKPLALNVSGAIPAVLLDAGYPAAALKGVPILARTAGLIAHLLEEQHRPIGFVLSHAGSRAVAYDGTGARWVRARGGRVVNGVLRGIRVVEQGTFITGPCAGMMLADLGADVLKIESPDGDPYRSYQGAAYSPHFQAYNRNKRSLSLDLKQESDRALFDGLIAEADVYIQNFRPGTADRLGAGADRLRGINPRLVYCSISGFGASGPYCDRPSYDSVAQALSGFLSVVVDAERPRFLGPALADAITGIYAAYGVLGALVERSRTGAGRVVEVSMLEAMTHFAVEPFAAYFALGDVPTSSDRPRLAQAYILRTSDSGLVAMHLSSLEKFWQALVEAVDAPQLGSDTSFRDAPGAHRQLRGAGRELDGLFRQKPLAEWVERLDGHDVPFAPMNRIDKVVDDPQVRHLGLVVPVESPHGGAHAVRPPVQFDGAAARSVTAAPLLDEHGKGIRAAIARGERWPALRADSSGARLRHG